MEALCSSNELFNFVIYDTISATPCRIFDNDVSLETTITTTSPNENIFLNNDDRFLLDHNDNDDHCHQEFINGMITKKEEEDKEPLRRNVFKSKLGVVGPSNSTSVSNNNNNNNKKKKRKRKDRVCKNKEEAENQRMARIAVERNWRKQMNEHLVVLRSLMPDSYVQRVI